MNFKIMISDHELLLSVSEKQYVIRERGILFCKYVEVCAGKVMKYKWN